MISPSNLMKRVGAGGGLVPFFKCVCVYFAVGAATSAPSAALVAAKCAPVLVLVLAVLLHHGTTYRPQGWYARRIALGLALSALGDALLVWPQHFVAGMCAFALAHCAYIAAFRFTPPARATAVAVYAATAYYMTWINPPSALRYLVPLYGALLATMAWRGVARGAGGCAGGRALCSGALLFLVSDGILGYSLFGGAVPYKQVLVMSTYYLAQLGISMSVLQSPRLQP